MMDTNRKVHVCKGIWFDYSVVQMALAAMAQLLLSSSNLYAFP